MSESTLMRTRATAKAASIVAASRARRGNATMTAPIPGPPAPAPVPAPAPAPPAPQPPTPPAERPEGVSETEWAALGDPGKTALVRERQRAQAAEQALAAVRTTPPTPTPTPAPPKQAEPPKGPDGQPDIAAIVQQAVAAAIQPFQERDAQREADNAATAIRDAVTTAAAERFHDATDALAQVDLTQLTDGTGRPDPQKITTALDGLLARKPHLGKVVDFRRQAPGGLPIGGTPGLAAPLDDRVKASLARMQQASGVKFADQ